MANWNSLILTNLGKELNAKINAGLTTLRFNRVALGSGTPTSSTITALSKEEQSFPFDVNPPKVKGRVMTLEFTAHNKDLVKQYTIRELGLFAQDPERGSILFAYMTDDAPDIMPARGAATVVTRKMNLNITTDNTGSVSVTTTGKFITIEDLNTHNTSSSAHADIRAKITSDINAHNISNSAHADIRRMFNNYLPLTGGTVSGRTHIDSMLSVGQSSEVASNIRVDGAAGNAYIALLNYNNTNSLLIDGYFNNPETAAIDVTNRDKNGTVRYRSTLIDGKGNAKFANEVYANEKLLATKEYVDLKKWGSTSITDGAVTPTKLDRPYLPLTGGTVTGRLHVNDPVSTGNDSMQFSNFIQTSMAGKAYLATGKNNSDNWFNVDGYFNNPEKSNIGVLKRNADGTVIARAYLLHNDNKTYFPNEVYSNQKLLATKEYVDTKSTNDINAHNTSSSAHNDIRQLFKWKKLYSVNRAAFVMPASGTALCDIPSTWKELHITWIWTHQTSTINNVVGYYSYTANIINEAIADPIIFVFPGSEGYLVVKNNKLYVIHRGDTDDGAPVLIMWR
ncbi:hypothetical protein [Veillonella caviae]|uniref:hypothetical protein n=1 Tax=Veillonella caviae TaxID=248316 RepID=UPI002A91991B|nr:hypothetical protein [Veillonella caviae]MDY5787005.1 hypothetical protein [Veillonella caviae]